MLSDVIRILNFDDSIINQKNLLKQFNPSIVDLKKIAHSCRLWLDDKTARAVQNTLQPEFKNSITLLGSGDYHHISSLLIEQFQEPLTVIIFDFHPDWDVLPPRLGCGSWVTNILKNSFVKKIILVGVSSHDLSTGWIQT